MSLRRVPVDGKLTPSERKPKLLAVALDLAVGAGFQKVTREMIASRAGVSGGLISRYWTAPELATAILDEAIRLGVLPVVAQGLAARHPSALAASESIRRAAAESLI